MEDDSGIELSLGLSCGGSSGKLKSKESCSDFNVESGKKRLFDGSLNISGPSVTHFIQTQIDKDDNDDPPRTDPVSRQQDNFWTDLGKCAAREVDASINAHGENSQFMGLRESWLAGTGLNRLNSFEKASGKGEENLDKHDIGGIWPGAGGKRKMPFEELDVQKKQGKENRFTDAHGNEDFAESESEGSTSRTSPSIPRICSDAAHQKDKLGFLDLSTAGGPGSVKQTLSAGTDSKVELGNLAYGSPFSSQPIPPAVTIPYSVPGKVLSAAANSSGSGFHHAMQLMPSKNESVSNQPINPGHFQLGCGYSPGQIPALDQGSSVCVASHPSQFSAFGNTCAGEGVASAERVANEPCISPGVLPHGLSDEVKVTDHAKNAGKRPLPEIARMSSLPTEDIAKGDKPKEAPEPLVLEAFLSEMPGIRPGIAAAVKFGGNGSYPDLPWVSTTGPDPNGKTISGVAYKYSNKEIKIVCACHGTHMTPDEFVEHAATGDAQNEESNNGLPLYSTGNPSASTKS